MMKHFAIVFFCLSSSMIIYGSVLDSLLSRNDYDFASFNKTLHSLLLKSESTRDSILIYNELSISNRKLHRYEDAVYYAKQGLNKSNYLANDTLLYKSNLLLANSFQVSNELDSAYVYLTIALKKAEIIGEYEKAIVLNNMALMNLKNDDLLNALICFENAVQNLQKLNEEELVNATRINSIEVLLKLGNLDDALELMELCGTKAKEQNWVYQELDVLNLKHEYHAIVNDVKILSEILDSISEKEHEIFNQENFEAEEKYQNERLLSEIEIKDLSAERRKWWLAALGSLLGLVVLGGGYYIYTARLKSRLEKANLIIQRQQALANERTRIAAEMHDDLGGGLTSIKFLSQKVLRNTEDEKQQAQIKKVVSHAQTLVGNMSEIIWAMDAGHDTVENLIAYCRRYAKTYLDEHDVSLVFSSEISQADQSISGEKRRNIFLTIKEALHNIVKHSEADRVDLRIQASDVELSVSIKDNGAGMGANSGIGNGLNNMRQRAEKLNAEWKLEDNDGVCISLRIPFTAPPW